jgi:hypothetical protein
MDLHHVFNCNPRFLARRGYNRAHHYSRDSHWVKSTCKGATRAKRRVLLSGLRQFFDKSSPLHPTKNERGYLDKEYLGPSFNPRHCSFFTVRRSDVDQPAGHCYQPQFYNLHCKREDQTGFKQRTPVLNCEKSLPRVPVTSSDRDQTRQLVKSYFTGPRSIPVVIAKARKRDWSTTRRRTDILSLIEGGVVTVTTWDGCLEHPTARVAFKTYTGKIHFYIICELNIILKFA